MSGEQVCICTTASGPPSWEYLLSVLELRCPGEKYVHPLTGKQGICEGHNRLIEWFLHDTGFEWMLHLDADATIHRDTLMRLLSWNVPFVSALAFQRTAPFAPVVYTDESTENPGQFVRPIDEILEWIREHGALLESRKPVVLYPKPADALWNVSRGGAHCCLTHRSVLAAIEPPWFMPSGRGAGIGAGGDFYFHKKALEAGFQPYVDMSVVAGHMNGSMCVSALDFVVWSRAGTYDSDGPGVTIISDGNKLAGKPECPPGTRWCSRCQACQPEGDFYRNGATSSGHDAYCKSHRAEAEKQYRQRKRERVESEIRVARRVLTIP